MSQSDGAVALLAPQSSLQDFLLNVYELYCRWPVSDSTIWARVPLAPLRSPLFVSVRAAWDWRPLACGRHFPAHQDGSWDDQKLRRCSGEALRGFWPFGAIWQGF